MSSNCTRCGKMRIVVRTWKETVGNSTIIHTDTECPNPQCQKQVSESLDKQKKQRQALEKEKLQREQERLNLKKNTI